MTVRRYHTALVILHWLLAAGLIFMLLMGTFSLDKLAPLAHWALYLLVLLMVASGMGTALLAGLPAIVFGGVGSLPADFKSMAPRAVHGIVAKLLTGVIVLHAAAALWHQFVRRDGLLVRVGLGPR